MDFPDNSISITLGGQSRVMVVDANTMGAYERVAKKFFLDTVMRLFDVMQPTQDTGDKSLRVVFGILREVPMEDLRILAWASLHEYDRHDEPVWPLSLSQVSRYITPQTVLGIFTAFLKAYVGSSPSKETLGESPAAPEKKSTTEASSTKAAASEPEKQSTPESGGTLSTAVPDSAFDLPDAKPAD